jgi:hypothetical protein
VRYYVSGHRSPGHHVDGGSLAEIALPPQPLGRPRLSGAGEGAEVAGLPLLAREPSGTKSQRTRYDGARGGVVIVRLTEHRARIVRVKRYGFDMR